MHDLAAARILVAEEGGVANAQWQVRRRGAIPRERAVGAVGCAMLDVDDVPEAVRLVEWNVLRWRDAGQVKKQGHALAHRVVFAVRGGAHNRPAPGVVLVADGVDILTACGSHLVAQFAAGLAFPWLVARTRSLATHSIERAVQVRGAACRVRHHKGRTRP